jgi:alpha-galactosidase
MIKIAMIGAGSLGFTNRLVADILTIPEFQDTEFRFMDINPEGLEMAANVCRKMISTHNLPATIHATLNRKEAIQGADYVMSFVRVGGLEAFEHDIQIPLKYGVDQCVGDTLGPGGIFYALRTIPVLLDIAADVRETAPGALFINYSNPMAMNCWALRRAGGVRVIGLCHGVQHGHNQIAQALGLPAKEVDFICAGINHQTWYIQVSYKGMDMLPFILPGFEKDAQLSKIEPLRIDVMRRFGYYSTESNGHLSEYLPWYRKDMQKAAKYFYLDDWAGGQTGGYLRAIKDAADDYHRDYSKFLSGEKEYVKFGERSSEHASYIIEGLETGRRYRGHFNVGNSGFITNLPAGCTVEIPCYVDANGISPTWVGELPKALAATCRASISVQEMAVEGALKGDREMVKLAVLHDPLTAAVCTPEEVWAMCDEMFEALAPWLPQFNGEGRTWGEIPLPAGGKLNRIHQAPEGWKPPALF